MSEFFDETLYRLSRRYFSWRLRERQRIDAGGILHVQSPNEAEGLWI
jgi:hypothetical protein